MTIHRYVAVVLVTLLCLTPFSPAQEVLAPQMKAKADVGGASVAALQNALANSSPLTAQTPDSGLDPRSLLALCEADFDADGLLTSLDVAAFLDAFAAGTATADFNADGFLTFEDFDAFVHTFDVGCVPTYKGPLFPGQLFAAGPSAYSLAAGDLDGDGFRDLVVANGSGKFNTVTVLRNLRNGMFQAVGTYETDWDPEFVVIGDLNGDGWPDLAVANVVSSTVSVLQNLGGGVFAAARNYPTGVWPGSVSLGDLDGDGIPDLAVANYQSNTLSVLRNLGNGTFAAKVDFATGIAPESGALADLNGDGRPDLVSVNKGANSVSVLLNRGDGTFAAKTDYATASGPVSVSVADVDNDGFPDIAVANSSATSVSILRNLGDGRFATKTDLATKLQPQSISLGDLNGDGSLDLAVAYGESLSIMLNRGDGTFAPRIDYASPSTRRVTIADLDNDGLADLAMASGSTNSASVMRNLGDGKFAARVEYRTAAIATAIAIGDLNGDGKPDLAVTSLTGSVSVLRNLGNGTFATRVDYSTGAEPTSLTIADLDGDGLLDLAVANYGANGGGNTLSVLRNLGNGVFAARVDYSTGSGPSSISASDLDGDGHPDLVVVNAGSNGSGETLSVLRNLGNGTFANRVDIPTRKGPSSLCIGDLDGDGDPDLVVTNIGGSGSLSDNTVSILRNRGNGAFETRVDYTTGLRPSSVSIGDLDGDGLPDLAVANQGVSGTSSTVSVLRNLGNATFGAKADYDAGMLPSRIAIADLNGDGRLDLAFMPAGAAVSVLLNEGSNRFTDKLNYSASNSPGSFSIGDLDGDGWPDLAIVRGGVGVSILRNQSGGAGS